MTTDALFGLCLSRGVRFSVAKDRNNLIIDAPKGAITPYIYQCLIKRKYSIIAILELCTEHEIYELYEIKKVTPSNN